MLTQILIKNLAIVKALELHFDQGMHTITGETGAGKSIIIDALSIALGERAQSEQIRAGQTQAEVTACFDIRKLPAVQKIIDNNEECIIRRVINANGRSSAYVNGVSVSAQQLKELAPHLIQIHSQHQHHALLHTEVQREILDALADHTELLQAVADLYKEWSNTKREIEQLSNLQQQSDRLTLLNYQLQELDNLKLQANELDALNQQHTQLCKADEILQTCSDITTALSGENAISDQMQTIINKFNNILKIDPSLKTCVDLLQQASINIQETINEIESHHNKLDCDPAKLQYIEQRLSTIHTLARKLRIDPQQLLAHQQDLTKQRDSLATATQKLEELRQQLQIQENNYYLAAAKLSQSRQQAASKLTTQVIARLQNLELPQAIFAINCEPNTQIAPTAHGIDEVDFKVTTNPGQPLNSLKKVASGGELSRISLAIQVISAQHMAIPTLILDEVDVGISGKTAATVGQLMRELAATAQIVCITHLPQVAAQGHIHFKVEKHQTKQDTITTVTPLKRSQRVAELARLLGGMSVTPEAIANAERMLEIV